MAKKAFALLLSFFLLGNLSGGAVSFAESGDLAGEMLTLFLSENGASSAQEWLDGALSDGAGISSEQYVFALRRYMPELDFSSYADALEKYLSENETSSGATRRKYALALLASGRGESAYVRSVLDEPLEGQSLMSLIYTLHLLNNGAVSENYTLEQVCGEILELRLSDGGWAVRGDNSDVDVTAMAVQALAPMVLSEMPEVGEAVEAAISLLSEKQLPDGDFQSMGTPNPESTAQVILALAACGSDPFTDERFVKNGNNLLDGLLKYRLESGGFSHTLGGKRSAIATSQAFSAAVSERGSLYVFDNADGKAPEQIPERTIAPETVPHSQKSGDYKPAAYAAIGGAAAIACVILLLLKKNPRNCLFVLILGAGAALFVLFTDLRSAEEYYSAEEIGDLAEIAGYAKIGIYCDTVIGEDEHIPADGVILAETELPFWENATVLDVLVSAAKKYGIRVENAGTRELAYISGIQDIYELDYGDLSGWMYFVNGESPSVGCGEYAVSDGDLIEWRYSREIGNDLCRSSIGETENAFT